MNTCRYEASYSSFAMLGTLVGELLLTTAPFHSPYCRQSELLKIGVELWLFPCLTFISGFK